MKNIVHIQNHDLVVSIQDMADFSNTKYESTKRLIQKYSSDFEDLGLRLPKEYDFKSVELNEPQATFLITLMKNNDIVRQFKKNLVMEFYRMREQLCEVNRIQLETAHNEIRQLQIKRMKTYKDGFMSLRKYIKENNIDLTEDTAWSMLIEYEVVVKRDVPVSKSFLLDDTFGRQHKDNGIEFNSRSLDLIFRDYIKVESTLFN